MGRWIRKQKPPKHVHDTPTYRDWWNKDIEIGAIWQCTCLAEFEVKDIRHGTDGEVLVWSRNSNVG